MSNLTTLESFEAPITPSMLVDALVKDLVTLLTDGNLSLIAEKFPTTSNIPCFLEVELLDEGGKTFSEVL